MKRRTGRPPGPAQGSIRWAQAQRKACASVWSCYQAALKRDSGPPRGRVERATVACMGALSIDRSTVQRHVATMLAIEKQDASLRRAVDDLQAALEAAHARVEEIGRMSALVSKKKILSKAAIQELEVVSIPVAHEILAALLRANSRK